MASSTTMRPARRVAHHLVCCQQRRSLTVSAPRRSQQLTAKDAADRMMSDFGGKSVTRRQLIDGNQLQKLALTLGRPQLGGPGGLDVSEAAPPAGTPVPPGYHLVYFTPDGVEAQLGADGTDRSFNAPSPFSRRMWAGGVMRWPGAAADSSSKNSPVLRVGDMAEERTRLISATAKKSRSAGEMVLVEVEKEFWTPRGLALVDQRSWIFRPELDPNAQMEPPKTLLNANTRAPTEITDLADEKNGNGPARQFRWSPTGLFRFSALTFNGHKIHYNEEWTQRVEAHPGLVVHGPLNLINMLDYWRDVHGAGRIPHSISYRAMSPVYAGETYLVRTEGSDDTGEGKIWDVLVDKNGVVCMKGQVLSK